MPRLQEIVATFPVPSPQLPQGALERNTRRLAELVITGLSTAPNLSATSPCLFFLPYQLLLFMEYATEQGRRRPLIQDPDTFIRLKFGKVLDIMVAFANSIWTKEQTKTFLSCRCKNHEEPGIKEFNETLYGEQDGSAVLQGLVVLVFSILNHITKGIMSRHGGAFKLEKDPNKRGKWPSSPSVLIPNGATAAVSAFMAWARLICNPVPLCLLGTLTSCCPSLDAAISENEGLVPLVGSLFSRFVRSIPKTRVDRLPPFRKCAIQKDIDHYFSVFNAIWLHQDVVKGPLKGPLDLNCKSRFLALASIYIHVCDFMPVIDQYLSSEDELDRTLDRFGSLGVLIYDYIIDAPGADPLHPILQPYTESVNKVQNQISMFAYAVLNLRNDSNCTQPSCTKTSESTKLNFSRCSQCQVAHYCSTECQSLDWTEHKTVCRILKLLMPMMSSYTSTGESEPIELVARFTRDLRDGGIRNPDIISLREYMSSHLRRGESSIISFFKNYGAWLDLSSEATDGVLSGV